MASKEIASLLSPWTPDNETKLLKIVRTEATRHWKLEKGQSDVKPAQEGITSLHEVVWDIFDEFSDVATAQKFWKRLVAVNGDPALTTAMVTMLSSLVLDVLVVLEIEATEHNQKERQAFIHQLVAGGLKDGVVRQGDVVARFAVASAAAILKIPEANLDRTYRLSISRHFFTLSEYNLLREEPEGYAKLISLLLQPLPSNSAQFRTLITNIIGTFSLQPNRVLDMIIASTGFHLDNFFARSAAPRSVAAYEAAVAPLIAFLKESPRSHLYSLLAFHLLPSPPKPADKKVASAATAAASSSSAAPAVAPAPTDSADTATEESQDTLPLQTSRILACLLHFQLLTLRDVMALLRPGAAQTAAAAQALSTASDDKTAPSADSTMDVTQEPSKSTTEAPSSEDDLTGDELFVSKPDFALLAALLEIPAAVPLAFLSDNSDASTLFNSLLNSKLCSNKRMAAVICDRVLAHLYPVYSPLLPSNLLRIRPNSAPESYSTIPAMQILATALLEVKDVLRLLGENITASLHHAVCILFSSLLDGIQRSKHSGHIGLSDTTGAARSNEALGSLPRSIDDVPYSMLSTIFTTIQDMLMHSLLPSFVCLYINGDSMWNLLQRFPYAFRYRAYHQWGKLVESNRYPKLKEIATDARLKVKGMMKRMTDVSIKETGRPLCKAGNRFPIVLSDLVKSLIFNNFVQPLADSMRYLTDVSLDVLVYSCLDAVLNMPAQQTPHLVNVATFLASMYKLYYERLDIVPLLDVIEQLMKHSKLSGATLFTTLLSKMGCVDILEETLSSQIKMVNSFPSLQTLAVLGGALSSRETSRSSIYPLRDRLWTSNSWLPLYILVLQLEKQWIYHADASDQATIANNFDAVHQLSLQLAEFTAHIFRKYSHQVNPSLLLSAGTIAQEYDISFIGVLHMFRPILHLMYKDVAQLLGKEPTTDASMDVDRSLHLLSSDLAFSRGSQGRTIIPFPMAENLRKRLDDQMPPPDPNAEYYIHKTDLTPIANINVLSNEFLAAFWGLRLIDVECDPALYKEAMQKQSQVQQFGSQGRERNDKTDDISPAMLEKDMTNHSEHVAAVFERLKSAASQEAHGWFSPLSSTSTFLDDISESESTKAISMAVLQHCIIPRTMQSAEDALFCGAFCRILHRINPPQWDSDAFFDALFDALPLVLSSATTNESSRFGRFICSILGLLVAWRDFDAWCADIGNREFPQVDEIAPPVAMDVDVPQQTETPKPDNASVDESAGDLVAEDVTTPAEPVAIDLTQDEPDASEEPIHEGLKMPEPGPSQPSRPAPPSSPLRSAHQAFCLKSLSWEKRLLDHAIAGLLRPVDRWNRRAVLFFLKEVSPVFPSGERFCVLLSHALKSQATGTEDMKALVNSYLNLLEGRAKSVLPHDKFAALYPGFSFPVAPEARLASSKQESDISRAVTPMPATTAATETKKAATPAPTTDTVRLPFSRAHKDDKPRRDEPKSSTTSALPSGRSALHGRDGGRESRNEGRDRRDRDEGARPLAAYDSRDNGRDPRDGPSDSRDHRHRDSKEVRGRGEQRDRDGRDHREPAPREGPRDSHRDGRDGGAQRDNPRDDRRDNPPQRDNPRDNPRSSGREAPRDGGREARPDESSNDRKRRREGSPEPPAPPAEKRQKTSETTSSTRPANPPAPTPPAAPSSAPPSTSSTSKNRGATSSEPADQHPREEVIGPPLPPKSSGGGRYGHRRNRY